MKRILIIAAYAVLCSSVAHAAPWDQLKCFKIKDEHKYSALMDLETNPQQIAAFPNESGCTVKVKSKEYCVPVQPTRTVNPDNPKDAPVAMVPGQLLDNGLLCYLIKCPKLEQVTELTLGDQFGERPVSGFKTSKICTPAKSVGPATYEDNAKFATLVSQTFVFGSPPSVEFRLRTSLEDEYQAGYDSVTLNSPAGWTLEYVSEVLTSRDCPSGPPSLDPGAGCQQDWIVRYSLPGVCDLNNTLNFTISVGCNARMDHCYFVDPADTSHTFSFVTSSSSFCP